MCNNNIDYHSFTGFIISRSIFKMAEQQEVTESGHKRVVVVSVDGSDHADHALDWYINQVRREDDHVVLVYIQESYDFTLTSKTAYEELKDEIAKRTSMMEERYIKKMKDKNIEDIKFRTMTGKAGEKVVQVADEEKAYLIVTGSRGMGTLRRTFLGSVSDYIIHHSHCPVLICRK